MLIIVKTPLQIICAVEYMYANNIEISHADFIYLRKYEFADVQVFNTFGFFGIENVQVIRFGNANLVRLFGFRIILSKSILLKAGAKLRQIVVDYFSNKSLFNKIRLEAEIIVLGDPNFKLYEKTGALISGKEIVLLDDGLSSLKLDINYALNHNKVISFSFLRKQAENAHVCMTNNFERMKSTIPVLDGHTILFIGQPLFEAGMCTLKHLDELFTMISIRFSSQKILYFAHRWEHHLQDITFPSNFEIMDEQNLPLELLINGLTAIPRHIISFYSSALITLKKILPEEVDFSAIKPEFVSTSRPLQDAYEKISSYGIDIITV